MRRWRTSSAGSHQSSGATLTVLSPSISHQQNDDDINDAGDENDGDDHHNESDEYNQRDIGLDFLAQLGGEELQEILKEAGITNAVHRYGTGHRYQIFKDGHGSDYDFSDIVFLRLWMVFKMIFFLTVGCRCVLTTKI